MTSKWVNLGFYRFINLGDRSSLSSLRIQLKALTAELQMKGTILLASEGINVMVSGLVPALEKFKSYCIENFGIDPKTFKEAEEPKPSFTRMLVKIKKEIIRMNHPTIAPEKGRAKFISPKKLKEWLDRGQDDLGRPVVMIDTRNGFEVEYGTFKNALHFNITKFSEFPQAIEERLPELSDKTLVSFCTGGIRCEKSGLYLRERGLEHSYQLDGGILQYFEDIGGDHYVGDCFVFDERETLEPSLSAKPQGRLKPKKNQA